MKHTKGKWVTSQHFDCGATVIRQATDNNPEYEGKIIANLQDYAWQGEFTQEENEANAKRIVTCVNSHDELLLALKKLRLACSDDENDYPDLQLYRIVMDACETAEKAIKNAEGSE